MKKIRIILSLLCVFALSMALFTGCGTSSDNTSSAQGDTAKGKLIVGTNSDFAPFEYLENGQVVGIDIDMINAIANEMNMTVEMSDMEFESLPNALASGTIDCIVAAYTVKPDRLESMDFSTAYYNASQSIIVMKDSAIASKDDLKGKRIGAQSGTTGESVGNSILGEGQVKGYSSPMLAVQDMQNGNLDAIIVDNNPAKIIADQNDNIKLIENQFDPEEYCIAVKKGNSELLDKINAALATVKSDGQLDDILKNYID